MKVEELSQYDTSFELKKKSQSCNDTLGITNFDYPKKDNFVFLKDVKFLNKVREIISADKSTYLEMGVICSSSVFEKEESFLTEFFGWIGTTKNIDLSMSSLSKVFFDEKFKSLNYDVDGRQMGSAEVHPTAWIAQGVFIGENSIIGENVRVHSGVVIMPHSTIEKDTEIFPNVVIYPYVKIGERCRIHANSSIGADGFGYNFHEGVHHKLWHMGGAIIESDVEVGANSNIDQGTFSPTFIGAGTKIDNQVQIGHNCQVGKGCIFCGHVAIGGSTKIGNYVVFGGKAAAGHGLVIGDACQIAGGGMVNCDWEAGAKVGGHPARPIREWMKGLAFVRRESLKK